MLTVMQQPRLQCPVSKSRPARYRIHTVDHVVESGSYANFQIDFSSSGASNGETIVVLNKTFTVQNTDDYTQTTFRADGTVEETARNLMNALLCNYEFQDFYLFLSGSGSNWTINGFYTTPELVDNWTFDTSGMAIAVSITAVNGASPELKDFRIWYQLYQDDIPVTSRRAANVPFDPFFPLTSGNVVIDVTEQAKGLIKTTLPSFLWNTPFLDTTYGERFHLRFGAIEFDANCNPIYGKAYKTSDFIMTNSVYQLEDIREFRRHCPDYNALTEFISDRPKTMNICGNAYEWIHVYLARNAYYVGNFRIRYRFYDENDNQINTKEYEVEDEGFYIIGIGTANTMVSSNAPSNTSYYQVQVFGQRIDELEELDYIQMSEIIQRDIVSCDCKVAEIYFLEDTGSWQTVLFERLEQRDQLQSALEYETPLELNEAADIKGQTLALTGERYSIAADADNVFVLTTERISERNRKTYERFLRSPTHLIRTATADGTEIIRRVIIDRKGYTILRRGEVIRLQIPFTFNTKTRVH